MFLLFCCHYHTISFLKTDEEGGPIDLTDFFLRELAGDTAGSLLNVNYNS